MFSSFKWGSSDPINLFVLIVYAIMAFLMWKTLREGQKQSKISLSISQFGILNNELKEFIEKARQITFKTSLTDEKYKVIREGYLESNGMNYINAFLIFDFIDYFSESSEERRELITDFRSNVLFPLTRFYDEILSFLTRTYDDKILIPEHKRILFYYIEKDLLQTYFRICNFEAEKIVKCNLAPFETSSFKKDKFHAINSFFKQKSLFQFKDLGFYQRTF